LGLYDYKKKKFFFVNCKKLFFVKTRLIEISIHRPPLLRNRPNQTRLRRADLNLLTVQPVALARNSRRATRLRRADLNLLTVQPVALARNSRRATRLRRADLNLLFHHPVRRNRRDRHHHCQRRPLLSDLRNLLKAQQLATKQVALLSTHRQKRYVIFAAFTLSLLFPLFLKIFIDFGPFINFFETNRNLKIYFMNFNTFKTLF
jgi:hypothetical protein